MRRSIAAVLVCMACTSVEFATFAQEAALRQRRDPQPDVRYMLGEDSMVQPGVPKGTLEGPFLFKSKIIADTVRQYWIYVPAQYDAAKPAAVLVFQDGARAINADGVLRVPQVLENLIAKNQIPVTIGIFITPGQRGSEFPESIGFGNPDNRDREYDVLNDTYARFLVEEMLPEVGKKYNLSTDPADRAIGGASSGAICAFTVAWERPDQFRNVLSMIGSYTNIHGGHVYPELVREADKKNIRIFLQDGIHDLRSPNDVDRDWYLQNQKMIAALTDKGYDLASVIGKGGHSDDHGGAILPQMLRWIWRDHPAVEPPASDMVEQARAVEPATLELFPGFNKNASIKPIGTYTWENAFRNMRSASKLTIQQDGDQLSGSLTIVRDGGEPTTVQLENPVMEGNKLIFDAATSFGGREFTSTYQGIVTPDGIKGWRLMDFGGQPRDTPWEADRQKSYGLLKTTSDLASWQFELAGTGKGSMEVDGDAIVLKSTELSTENWHVQAYQTGIHLQNGAQYELTFKAKSAQGMRALALGLINQEDWHVIGLAEGFFVGRTYEEFRLIFTAENVVPNNNRIGFVIGDELGTLYVKDMKLTKLD